MTARILVATVGPDGHDRHVEAVARVLRDDGFEVVYAGPFQTPDAVAAAAVDEDVDVIGLSMTSDADLALAGDVTDAVRASGADVPVSGGGIVAGEDVSDLGAAGIAAILAPDATADEVVTAVRQVVHAAV